MFNIVYVLNVYVYVYVYVLNVVGESSGDRDGVSLSLTHVGSTKFHKEAAAGKSFSFTFIWILHWTLLRELVIVQKNQKTSTN